MPAIAQVSNLMQIRGRVMLSSIPIPDWCPAGWVPANGALVDRFQFPELFDQMYDGRKAAAFLKEAKTGEFRLPFSSPIWEPNWSENAKVRLPIVAVEPQRWPNGRLAAPGFTAWVSLPGDQVGAEHPVSPTESFAWKNEPWKPDTMGQTS